MGSHDSEGESLDVVSHRLAEFAATYASLPLYAGICTGAAGDAEVASLLTAAQPGQARPVLLLAALHDLVLRDPSVPAARWFTSVGGRSPAPGEDPWPEVRATCLEHAPALRAVIATRATQTNEVNRSVYVAALLAAACADVGPVPVALVEQGCSAGLLLGLDRYRVEVGDVVLGDPASPVRCVGALADGSARPAPTGLPPIVERVGLDREPVALDDDEEVRWLEACLWPDQPERLERFRAAVAVLRADPPLLVAGDMVDDLGAVAHSARAVASALAGPDVHLVVVVSWALTYVRRDRRPLVADALAELAADGRPVSWLTAEPPGAVPGIDPPPDPLPGGSTVLGLRRWRAGVELPPRAVGHAHPHAPWLHLT
ncbi:DUF2332 domain-containing protein [Iamia sp. SCSIO 61187]|uniref:DUF2332 domain-containing protein n=1 Tax=Iamia sp. SCSIO 61187 TaxID=2722752 RepID=UPI001C628685|nr:DUF2332 domain-containing protein [Iamia sp. SCSIO 61187]QYG92079.1 DUF2332 domain-containing protein [Iamia sp. SCSIO 61187]